MPGFSEEVFELVFDTEMLLQFELLLEDFQYAFLNLQSSEMVHYRRLNLMGSQFA